MPYQPVPYRLPPMADDERQKLLRSMEQLGPRDAEILRRRFWGGEPYREIAQSLGSNEQAVRTAACRALQKFKKLWNG